MNWTSLQKLIPVAAGKYDMVPTMKAIQVCQEYRSLAPKMLPADILLHSFPHTYKNQTLIIGVKNSAWAEKIQLNKHKIQEELNKKFGENTVKKIVIQLLPEEEAAPTAADSLDIKKPTAIH